MLLGVFKSELRRFPGLAEADTPADLALDFFADRAVAYVDAVLAAPDDQAATRRTRQWARNWLIDRVRKTPYGALRNRLEKRLRRSPLFRASSAAHHWYLEGEDDIDRTAVSFEEIYEVAAEVRVDVVFDVGGRVVLGQPGQLEEMLRAILKLCGRLHIADITYLCAKRFPAVLEDGDWLMNRPRTTEIEDATDTHPSADVIHDTAEQLVDACAAKAIFNRLTAVERLALRFAEDPLKLASRLGVGRSTAYSHVQRAKAKLMEIAGDQARGREVATDVLALILDDELAVPSVTGEGA